MPQPVDLFKTTLQKHRRFTDKQIARTASGHAVSRAGFDCVRALCFCMIDGILQQRAHGVVAAVSGLDEKARDISARPKWRASVVGSDRVQS